MDVDGPRWSPLGVMRGKILASAESGATSARNSKSSNSFVLLSTVAFSGWCLFPIKGCYMVLLPIGFTDGLDGGTARVQPLVRFATDQFGVWKCCRNKQGQQGQQGQQGRTFYFDFKKLVDLETADDSVV